MKLDGLQTLQRLKHWQHSVWRQIDLRLPLGTGILMLILILATLLTGIPQVAVVPLPGYLLLAAYLGHEQPASPLLVATAITAPLIILDALLALLQPDGLLTTIWLIIALVILLLCLTGAFTGAWLQGRQQKI